MPLLLHLQSHSLTNPTEVKSCFSLFLVRQGERRKEKGERRKEKGERRKEKGERRKEKGEKRREPDETKRGNNRNYIESAISKEKALEGADNL
jgi:hypothetical protein